ncbi:MAG: PorT family protein [Bacteroidaceae bacterium]|nr:PorT family protein [Bacteroidaceae bacterium]
MKRLLSSLIASSMFLGLCAQEQKIMHRPYLDTRQLHYGFFVGLNMMDMEMKNNGYIDPASGDQWYADVDNYQPGFTVGVLGELRLNKTFALRLAPAMNFGQKHIGFHEQLSGRDSTQNIKSAYISVPLELKIAAPRYNNFRPYVLLGVAPSIDLTVKNHRAIMPKRFDCFLEIAMGCDIYLPFFKLIPELKFSFGLLDILQKNRTDLIDASLLKFTKGLDKSHSRMISLTFYFE